MVEARSRINLQLSAHASTLQLVMVGGSTETVSSLARPRRRRWLAIGGVPLTLVSLMLANWLAWRHLAGTLATPRTTADTCAPAEARHAEDAPPAVCMAEVGQPVPTTPAEPVAAVSADALPTGDQQAPTGDQQAPSVTPDAPARQRRPSAIARASTPPPAANGPQAPNFGKCSETSLCTTIPRMLPKRTPSPYASHPADLGDTPRGTVPRHPTR